MRSCSHLVLSFFWGIKNWNSYWWMWCECISLVTENSIVIRICSHLSDGMCLWSISYMFYDMKTWISIGGKFDSIVIIPDQADEWQKRTKHLIEKKKNRQQKTQQNATMELYSKMRKIVFAFIDTLQNVTHRKRN